MPQFRKVVASLLILVNAVTPVMASAAGYFYRVPYEPMKIRSGAPLPNTWVDPANTSSATVAQGGAVLRVAASDIDFGQVAVTRSARAQTVTLYNAGGKALTLGHVSASSQFSVTDSCDGVVVPPLGNCKVNVSFAPTQIAAGPVTGALVVPFLAGGLTAEARATLHGITQAPPAGSQSEGGLTGFEQSTGDTPPGGPNEPEASYKNGVASIEFPQAIINQQSWSKTFVVASTGDTALAFNGVSFTGNDGSFTAANNCPSSIPAGQQCTVTVTFAPMSIGEKTAKLVVSTNGYTGNNTPIQLHGLAVEVYPVYGANSTPSVDFKSIVQGAASASQTVTVVNSGSAPMTIGKPVLTGQSTGLNIAASTCTAPIGPGSSCAITLTLSAAAPTTLDAKLEIPHDGRLTPTSPARVPVVGEVVAQTRVLSYPTTLDWESPDVGTPSSRTLTITNAGNSPVSNIGASTTSPFSVVTNNCSGVTLQPNSSCTITFNLTPTANGVVSRPATITATGLTTPAAGLNLTGSARTRTLAAMSPSSYGFGLQSTMTWSNTQYVATLTNTGNVLTRPAVANRNAGDNTLTSSPWVRVSSDTCAAGVNPGESCQIAFQVKPTSTTNLSTSVTFYPDAGMTLNGRSVTVTATGTQQSYDVSVSSLEFGTVGSLQYVDRVVTVTNTSAPNVSLTGFSSVGLTNPATPAGAATLSVPINTCATGSVAPGGTCSFTVRLTGKSYASTAPVALTGGSISFYYTGARSATQVLPLSAALVGSELTVSSANPNFGDIPVGVSTQAAARRTLTVSNTGEYPVAFGSYSLSSATGGLLLTEDASVAGRCTAGTAIPAGGNCTLTFYSTPGSTVAEASLSRIVSVRATSLNTTVALEPSITFLGRYTPPTVSTSVPEIDFGMVGERTTVTRNFTFQVSHGGAGYWLNAPVTGTGYSATVTGCTTSRDLITGQVCTVAVQFAPGAFSAATMAGSISLNFNVGGSTTNLATIPLTAQVEKSAYVVDSNNLAWGAVPTQTAGSPRYAVIRNASSSATMPLTGTRTVAAPFTLSASTSTYTYEGSNLPNCVGLSQLTSGQRCYISVSLSGTTGATAGDGAFAGNVVLATGTAEGSIAVPLSANFLRAAPEVSASQIVFPTPTQSTTSHNPDMTVSVSNPGGGRLYWANNPSQTYPFQATGDFWLVRANGTVAPSLNASTVTGSQRCEEQTFLDPGASCVMTVRFTPTGSAGAKSGSLTLSAISPDLRTLTVALSGTAQAGEVYMNQENVNFGEQLVGSSTTRTVLIGNGGNGSMGIRNIQRFRIDGTPAAYGAEFTVAHNCPASLPSGSECLLNVTFAPDRNLDWGALPIPEVVQYEHFSNGVWNTVKVPLLAVGHGSALKVNRLKHDLGAVETTKVAQTYTDVLTFTASGEAPVRIMSFTPKTLTYLETGPTSTCTSNLVLQPGASCTLTITNRADFSTYSVGRVTDIEQQVFTINGSFLNDGGEVLSDRSATLLATADMVKPTTLVEINPRAVSTQVATPAGAFGTDFRPGAQLLLDGTLVSSTLVSPTEIRFQIPAGMSTGSHTVSVRNTDGRNITASATFAVSNFALSTNNTADVHTVAYDRPYLLRTPGVDHAAILADGREVYVDKAGNIRLYDTAGNLVASATIGARYNIGAVRVTAVGSNVMVGWVSGRSAIWSSSNLGSGYVDYQGEVNAGVQSFAVGPNSLTAGASSYTVLWSGTSLSNSPTLTVTGMDVSSNGTQTVMAYSYNIAGVGATTAARVWSGTATGPAYAISGSNLSVGTALANGIAYVKTGDKVTTYSVSGTSLSGGATYQYAGALSGSADGLVFRGATGELVTACFTNRGICVIPTAGDALGSLALLTGDTSSARYADGNYSSAAFDIDFVGPHPSGVLVFQNGTPAASRVVNLRDFEQRAVLEASASRLDFGQVDMGSTSTQSILLQNVGSQNLSFQNVTTTSKFTAKHNCPAELSPGTQCTVTVDAKPDSPDTFEGSLSILTNATYSNAATIPLKVVGGGSRASISPNTVEVRGAYMSGTATGVAQVSNTGTKNMTLTSVTGLNASTTLTGNTCSDIAPAQTCQLTFSIQTNTLGTTTSSITTVGANVNTGATVTTSVTGTIARWETTSAKFRAGFSGSTTIKLHNDGNIAANFAALEGIALPFSASLSGCNAVAAGGFCSVTVTYAPTDNQNVSQAGIVPAGANARTNALTLTADASVTVGLVSGSKALAGIAGGTLLHSGSVDDSYLSTSMPFAVKFFGNSYSTLYVGSNSYITFGSGSSAYSGQTLTNPALPGIVFGGADNSYQRVYSTTGSLNGIPFQRIRYEGSASTSGSVGSPSILVEVTFFAPTATEQLVEVNIAQHGRTGNVFGVKNSSSAGTVNGGSISQYTTYVFKSDSSGNNWTITPNAHVE